MLKKFLQTGVLSIFAGALFAGTIALASWTAHWWGTDWIQSGETISAQKIAENFEYLKQRVDEIGGATSTASILPECADGTMLYRSNGEWKCAVLFAKFGSGNRCKNDKIRVYCGQENGKPWNYNYCYTLGHAQYYNSYPEWRDEYGGYYDPGWGGIKVDVICDMDSL